MELQGKTGILCFRVFCVITLTLADSMSTCLMDHTKHTTPRNQKMLTPKLATLSEPAHQFITTALSMAGGTQKELDACTLIVSRILGHGTNFSDESLARLHLNNETLKEVRDAIEEYCGNPNNAATAFVHGFLKPLLPEVQQEGKITFDINGMPLLY